MFRDKEYMLEPASFLVFPKLVVTAHHYINRTPESVAEEFNLYVESSYDFQLGKYVFVGFQKGEYIFGLKRQLDSPNQNYSVVSVLGAPEEKKGELIAEALGLKVSEVTDLELNY